MKYNAKKIHTENSIDYSDKLEKLPWVKYSENGDLIYTKEALRALANGNNKKASDILGSIPCFYNWKQSWRLFCLGHNII